MAVKNLYSDIPAAPESEHFEDIFRTPAFRVERIVSCGHGSPDGFWYDQDHGEWVLLLKGRAALVFEYEKEAVILEPGDYLNIPAHARHRVLWTDPEQETIWLAIHY